MKEYERLTKKAGWHKDIDLTQELGYSYIYQRLSELETKIENGTLIELPCKAGTKVYLIIDYPAYFEPIEETIVNGVSQFCIDGIIENQITTSSCLCFNWERDFGKTVFLTKAEAEKKLKELKVEE